jgi:hypothetical protein
MRPENFSNLPVEERRTIIQAEITKIEKGNTHNTITSRRLRKKKAELANLDNPEAVSVSNASTVSSEPSNIDESSNVDNDDEQSNGESNQSSGSTKEFILTLDDPEVANYNKIQFLKARYINLQTQSKNLINLFSLILLCLTGFARFQIGFPQKHVTVI